MKSMVIFVVLLILFSNVYAVEDVDIPETFETTQKTIGESETTYFYAGSKLLASKDSSGLNYHYQDRLESDIESKSLPFGQSLKVGERFSFTGKELDEDLYYFNARYYDSSLGRFTSVDPVPSQPAYQYVANNPIKYVDPTGTVMDEPPHQTARDRQILRESDKVDDVVYREPVDIVAFDEYGMPLSGYYLKYESGRTEYQIDPNVKLGVEPQWFTVELALGASVGFKGAGWSLSGLSRRALGAIGLPDPVDTAKTIRLLASDINPNWWRIVDPSAEPGKRVFDVDTETLVKYLDDTGQLPAGDGAINVYIEFTDLNHNVARRQTELLRSDELARELNPLLDPSLRPSFKTDFIRLINPEDRLESLTKSLGRPVKDEVSGLARFPSQN